MVETYFMTHKMDVRSVSQADTHRDYLSYHAGPTINFHLGPYLELTGREHAGVIVHHLKYESPVHKCKAALGRYNSKVKSFYLWDFREDAYILNQSNTQLRVLCKC